MDPLSIISGVGGLIGLAIQVAPSIYEYLSDVKAAQDDAKRYANEVYALVSVTERLHVFLKSDAARGCHFRTTESVLQRTVESCDACLRDLVGLLKSPVGWSRKLKWPVHKKRVDVVIARLERYTRLFQYALTVEGCAILSQTPEDVTTILNLQVDASSKLHEITKGISALRASSEQYRHTASELASMVEGIRSFSDSSQRLQEIQEGIGSIKRHLTDNQDREILDWLSPGQARLRHHEVRSRRTPGTGKWICDTPSFQEWRDESSSRKLLWFVGPPGCGKSTLLSLIIDELKASHANRNTAIAYYYCDYHFQGSHPLTLALGSILRMLVERLGSLPESLRELFASSHREAHAPLPSELESLLHAISSSFTRCFILVDAMDEFSIGDSAQTAQLTRVLDSLARAGVQVLVTSRTLPVLSLSSNHSVKTHIATETDIRSYVAHTLSSDDSMVDILDDQLKDDIISGIVGQVNGMFLLAVLHLQTIRDQVTRSGVRKALSKLSSDLGDAYEKTFQAINHQPQARQKLALDALVWVSSTERPLNSLELRHALATQDGDKDLDMENIPSVTLIVRSCCGLIVVDDLGNDLSEVRLVHETLNQYLHNRQKKLMSQAHPMITRTSLTYLLFECIDGTEISSSVSKGKEKAQKQQKKDAALVPFALQYWGHHAALSSSRDYISLAMQLLTNSARLQILYPENQRMTGLHIAAEFGLKHLTHRLITHGLRVNFEDNKGDTPLRKACAFNHKETATLLLKNGAKHKHWNLALATPLFTAAEKGHKDIAEMLLDHGAEVDGLCKDRWTPLHKAADSGHYDLVRLLVRRGSSITRTSSRGLAALHRAAGRGHTNIMQFLIECNAQVDAVTRDGWTALHGASSSGQTEAAILLLDNGADVHQRSNDGKAPLHRACRGGYLDTVETLIEHGADVMMEDTNQDLPLHIAAREGHGAVIECLLKNGTQQLSHVNKYGWTPLHESQLSGFHTTEKLLREKAHSLNGADISGEDEMTRSIQLNDVVKVNQLLKTGAIDLETHDKMGRTLLHQAFHSESYKVASALLDAGADIHAASAIGGWQPIHYAALSGDSNALRLCLDHGADCNARNERRQTVLHRACRTGNEETVQLLLDRKADLEAADDLDWRPLHVAASAGHKAVVSMLLDRGADIMAKTVEGKTFQACASQGGHHSLVEFIREVRYAYAF